MLQTEDKLLEFGGQLEIFLSQVTCYDIEGKHSAYLAPDAAWLWINVLTPLLMPYEGHIYLYVSSWVDVWRPWFVSFRAAQKKANASLPGESPHFFGISFDIDLETTGRALTAASKRVKEGTASAQDKKVISALFDSIHLSWKWKEGDAVSSMHIRSLMKSLGFLPHRDTNNELWHNNIARAGDSNGASDVLVRYPVLSMVNGKVDQEVAQNCLRSCKNPKTGKSFYEGPIDGAWGKMSKAAWKAFYDAYPAAFIRSSGFIEKARMLAGMTPGKRGMRILQTYTAKFTLVTPREVL